MKFEIEFFIVIFIILGDYSFILEYDVVLFDFGFEGN